MLERRVTKRLGVAHVGGAWTGSQSGKQRQTPTKSQQQFLQCNVHFNLRWISMLEMQQTTMPKVGLRP